LTLVFAAGDVARQLPNDARDMQSVDKTWRMITGKFNDTPHVAKFTGGNQILPDLENAIATLEKAMRSVEEFVETKRIGFPQLHFISNDELVDLLVKSKEPAAINPFLPKLFDSLHSIEITFDNHGPTITAMFSIEGERSPLRGIKYRNNLESWLATIEEAAQRTLKTDLRAARRKYTEMVRENWIQVQPMQYVLTVTQIEWARQVENAFQSAAAANVMFTDVLANIEHKLVNLTRVRQLELRDAERENHLGNDAGSVHAGYREKHHREADHQYRGLWMDSAFYVQMGRTHKGSHCFAIQRSLSIWL
jgi:dynein heavy chain